ncbi:hypothetical protein DUNSADRAFT_10459 [Dunaliella salina]|uniref:Plastid lipid-associated protein/fibrillin conserved domain-containing protein n=1 Tax=Dunaliella salina TaxID=3046 RepID=A0ABQ7GFC2_DUNSA|nr:hypothetical protein DUNSADRAFT_10459 [Dunaliella salina]|eukprot:KAF5833294.1 hypothetical protein DUNSADRAFT_10459 [Dunaliella salina]
MLQGKVTLCHKGAGPQRCASRTLPTCRGSSRSISDAGSLIAQKKAELRQTIRELETTPPTSDTSVLASQIRALNDLNPTPDPNESPKLTGTWVLLYTKKLEQASGGDNFFQALSGSLYGLIYKYLPVLGGSAVGKSGSGAVRSRGNFQTFAPNTVVNESRFEVPALGQDGVIRVDGTAEVVPGDTGQPLRLRATFTSFSLTLGERQRLRLPLTVLPSPGSPFALSGPVGYVDTSFLDDEMRISTGDKGSVFIAVRKREPL